MKWWQVQHNRKNRWWAYVLEGQSPAMYWDDVTHRSYRHGHLHFDSVDDIFLSAVVWASSENNAIARVQQMLKDHERGVPDLNPYYAAEVGGEG